MTATITTEPIVSSRRHEEIGTSLDSGSLVTSQRMIGEILPELIERAARDPFFRESLIEDSRSTIESILSHRASHRVSLPDYLTVTVVEDSDGATNLVAPNPTENMKGSAAAPSPVCNLLIEASNDPELLTQLKANPTHVLVRELSARGYPASGVSELPEIKVITPEANEIVIVLPNRLLGRVAASSAIETELNLAEWFSGESVDSGRIVASYTSTAFTYCGNECSSNICSSNRSYCSCP